MILKHQLPAFEKLLAVGRACFGMSRLTCSIKPRTNTMIIGPSGSGKTHLARAVAEELGAGAAYLNISVSEWILLGCSERGAQNTWPMVCDFLLRHHSSDGLVIFIDELDKISGDSSWNQHLRNELFQLLDFQVPTGIQNDDEYDAEARSKAESILKNRTLILAAGAFQHLWHTISKPIMGFGRHSGDGDLPIEKTNLSRLIQTLPAELVLRFRSDLVVLPQLTESDYHRMLDQAAGEVPHYLRTTFLRLGRERIPGAVECGQGCRFVEELLLDTVIEERSLLQIVDKPPREPEKEGPNDSP
ncbi:hypothetical protein BH09VER1_BH09VER1_17770 [soil metagenome]